MSAESYTINNRVFFWQFNTTQSIPRAQKNSKKSLNFSWWRNTPAEEPRVNEVTAGTDTLRTDDVIIEGTFEQVAASSFEIVLFSSQIWMSEPTPAPIWCPFPGRGFNPRVQQVWCRIGSISVFGHILSPTRWDCFAQIFVSDQLHLFYCREWFADWLFSCPIGVFASHLTLQQRQIFYRFHRTRHALSASLCVIISLSEFCSTTGWLHHCKKKRPFPATVHVRRLSFVVGCSLRRTSTLAHTVFAVIM